MAPTSPKQLAKDLTAGRFRPVYFFFGQEDYRIGEAVKFLSSRFLPDSDGAANLRRFDLKRARLADLMTDLAALPLLGERQVFVVSHAQGLKAKELDSMASLFEGSADQRLLVLTSPSTVVARGRNSFVKRAFFKAVSKLAEVVEFNRFTPAEVRGSVSRLLEKADIKIEPEALTLLTELVAGSSGGLESEIYKLIDFKGAGATVGVADVRRICSGYQTYNVFELVDSIVAGNTRKSLAMLDKQLAEGESPVGIGIMLQNHFRQLYAVKGGVSSGGPPWLMRRLKEQAMRFDLGVLEQAICAIAEADAEFRRGRLKPEMTMESLVVKLTGQQG